MFSTRFIRSVPLILNTHVHHRCIDPLITRLITPVNATSAHLYEINFRIERLYSLYRTKVIDQKLCVEKNSVTLGDKKWLRRLLREGALGTRFIIFVKLYRYLQRCCKMSTWVDKYTFDYVYTLHTYL